MENESMSSNGNANANGVDLEEEVKGPLLEKAIGDRENQDCNYGKAIQHYLTALDKLKDLFEKRTNELAKDFSKAKKLIETVGIPCHLNLSLCYMKIGDWRKCVYECDKVLQMDKTNSKAIFRRSRAHAELNELNKAKEDYCLIKAMMPNSKEVESLGILIKDKEISQSQLTANNLNKRGIIYRIVSNVANNYFVALAIDIGYKKPKSICNKATDVIVSSVYTVKYISIDYPLSIFSKSFSLLFLIKDKLISKVKTKSTINEQSKIE